MISVTHTQIDWVNVMASQCQRRCYQKLSFVPCVTAHMKQASDCVLLAPPSILMYFFIMCCWMKLRRRHILHSCWKKRKQRCVLVWWPPARGCSSPAKNCLWCHQKMMTSSLGLLELRKDVNKGQNQIQIEEIVAAKWFMEDVPCRIGWFFQLLPFWHLVQLIFCCRFLVIHNI